MSLGNLTVSEQFILENGILTKSESNADFPKNVTRSMPTSGGLRRTDFQVEKLNATKPETELNFPKNDTTQETIHHEWLDTINSGRQVILRPRY